jgi:hypothetical protein
MSPMPADQMAAAAAASPLMAQLGTAVDRESARELLAGKMQAAADADAAKAAQAEYDKAVRDARKSQGTTTRTTTTRRQQKSPIDEVLGSRTGQTVIREVLRGIFSTLKRR